MAAELKSEAPASMATAEPMTPPREADAHGMLMSLVKVSQTIMEAAGSVAVQARESVETSRKLSDTAVLVAEEAQRTIRSMREAADMEIGALRRRLEEATQLPPQRLVSAPVEGQAPAPEVAPPSAPSPAHAAHQRLARPRRHLMARDGWLVPTVVLVCVIMGVSVGILFWRLPSTAAAGTQAVILSSPPPRGDVGVARPPGAGDRIPDRYLAPDEKGGN